MCGQDFITLRVRANIVLHFNKDEAHKLADMQERELVVFFATLRSLIEQVPAAPPR